ncbi:hypothetical protein E2C01_090692 [Portunus trituberculatus]|uniref:Uncharacterized protein n=1 Tax=Portunus trituberculatus TaxID=210409 RepID=A0A5B7JR25_PORTR|nr:hypothetical protein [Portunus trituberculatus]
MLVVDWFEQVVMVVVVMVVVVVVVDKQGRQMMGIRRVRSPPVIGNKRRQSTETWQVSSSKE